MRIAYLTSLYPAASHTFIRREIHALRQLGVSVDTFSVRRSNDYPDLETENEARATYYLVGRSVTAYIGAHLTEFSRYPVRYLGTIRMALRHRAPGLKGAFLSVAHFVESILLAAELRHRCIVHLHNHFANSGATVGMLASRQAEIGWSFTIHGISEFDYPAGILLAEKIEMARFVACVSYFGIAQAARLSAPELWPKLKIIRCGVELDQMPSRPARKRRGLNFIAVGRLSPEKGFEGLLEAYAAMIADPRPHLTIVGDGPLLSALRRKAASLGISSNITFSGRLSEPETLAAIGRSDVLVLSSFMEGLPVVLMEARAQGVSVIASRVAGIPELVEDNSTGLLFTPANWPELTIALDRLAEDAALRARLGKSGRERVVREFDVRSSAVRILDQFRLAVECEPNS